MLRAEFYYNINTDQEEAELLSLEGKGDGSRAELGVIETREKTRVTPGNLNPPASGWRLIVLCRDVTSLISVPGPQLGRK